MIVQNSGYNRDYSHTLRSTRGFTRCYSSINIQNLPDEVLFIMLEFVDVLDAVVLHKVKCHPISILSYLDSTCDQVSKLFYRLLHEDWYWRTAYRKRRIPRPPGPFEGQPTSLLRKVLVRSAKVQHNWPPFVRSPHPTSRVVMSNARQHLSIIHGRWVISGDPPLLLCFDTSNPDWDATSQIFYKPHLSANYFQCFSMTAEDGQELIFAVSDTQVGNVRRKL